MGGEGKEGCISKSVAGMASTAMTLFYVSILYAPTAILRLPPPTSLSQFLNRRFICAAISSLVSILFSSFIFPVVADLLLKCLFCEVESWGASQFYGCLWHKNGPSWVVTAAFMAGMMGFPRFLFPQTNPNLYNDSADNCRCWHGYCTWK